MNSVLKDHPELRCPQCRGNLRLKGNEVCCDVHRFRNSAGIFELDKSKGVGDDSVFSAIKEDYDLNSLKWRNRQHRSAWYVYSEDRHVGAVDDFRGKVVVDLGCGAGMLAKLMARRGAKRVYAVDLSYSMCALLKQDAEPKVFPVVANAVSLPFADGSIDVVLTSALVEITPDLERVVAEIARVLKPGGQVVFLNINDAPLNKILIRLMTTFVYREVKSRFGHVRRLRDVVRIVRGAGLRVSPPEYYGVGMFIPPLFRRLRTWWLTRFEDIACDVLAKSKLAKPFTHCYLLKARK